MSWYLIMMNPNTKENRTYTSKFEPLFLFSITLSLKSEVTSDGFQRFLKSGSFGLLSETLLASANLSFCFQSFNVAQSI